MPLVPGISSSADQIRYVKGLFNLSQAAATYTLLTATGDVWVEIVAAYVKTAAAGLTSLTVQTDHTTPKSIVASALLAAVTQDLSMTVVTSSFLLPSTKHITGTIVGTGSGGEIDLVVRWFPMASGATLA